MSRKEELRIHALGAAISRRDWFAVEQAHAAIRDAFHARAAEPADGRKSEAGGNYGFAHDPHDQRREDEHLAEGTYVTNVGRYPG